MSTNIKLTDIILTIISIFFAILFTMLIKHLFKNYRRPNGKKGGFISLHVVIAFSIITCIGLITKDWFITGLTVILAYLIGRGRLDEKQHYMYQVIISSIIGISIPILIFYLYIKKINNNNDNNSDTREDYEDKPEKAIDNRHEADIEAPELKLEDLE